MKQRWTLHIEDFAKIKQAEIEIRPFTLFVGENNTGKSYVATLLWGLWALPQTLFPKEVPTSQVYGNCVSVINELLAQLKVAEQVVVTNEQQQLLIDFFNQCLNINKAKLIRDVFGKSIDVTKIEIKGFAYQGAFELAKEKLQVPVTQIREKVVVDSDFLELDTEFEKTGKYTEILYQIIKRIVYALLFSGYMASRQRDRLVIELLGLSYGAGLLEAPLFMPASRTGFMLSYPALVADGLDQQNVKLTLPLRLYLKGLVQKKPRRNIALGKIATWLETNLLKGRVEREDSEAIPQYQYKVADETSGLPMHLVSSLVAEVAPIVHFLRHFNRYKALFIEEPEAHLHPAAQRIMARCLAKVSNQNVPLVVTTHGDTLFQQLNNLVVLHSHPNQKQLLEGFGYEKDEVLNPENIVAYQFKKEAGCTTVTKLESTDYGIPVPTFNEPLESLFDEIQKLQEEG